MSIIRCVHNVIESGLTWLDLTSRQLWTDRRFEIDLKLTWNGIEKQQVPNKCFMTTIVTQAQPLWQFSIQEFQSCCERSQDWANWLNLNLKSIFSSQSTFNPFVNTPIVIWLSLSIIRLGHSLWIRRIVLKTMTCLRICLQEFKFIFWANWS